MKVKISTGIGVPIVAAFVILLGIRTVSTPKETPQQKKDYIAFQSTRTRRFPKYTYFARIPFRGKILDVFIMDLGSRTPILISRDEQLSQAYYRGRSRWSPDRKWLAWPGEYALFVSDLAGKSRAVYEQRPPKQPYHVLPPWGFAWGPDSKRLAIWKSSDGQTVICRLDGTVEKEIQGIAGATLVDLDWSQDDKLVQVFDKGDGAFGLYLLNADGKTLVRKEILSFKGVVYGVKFSPKSKELVFVGKTEKGWSIYRVGVDGKNLTELVQNVTGKNPPKHYRRHFELTLKYSGNRPRWSPDGQRLTFGNNGHIHVVNRDGTDSVDVTPPGMIADFPVWSPDGKRIAFHAGPRSGNPDRTQWNIWLLDADGKNLEQVTKHRADDMFPEWAGD